MQNTTIVQRSQSSAETWPYRRWLEQARRLYPADVIAQDVAIAKHLRVCLAHARAPERRAWLEALGRRLLLDGR